MEKENHAHGDQSPYEEMEQNSTFKKTLYNSWGNLASK